jgi:hypothetical protein
VQVDPISPDELGRATARRKTTPNTRLLEDFMRSGDTTVKVSPDRRTDEVPDDAAVRVANTLSQYCRKAGLPIRVLKRGPVIYLTRLPEPAP